MSLPELLTTALLEEIKQIKLNQLQKSYEELSNSYRNMRQNVPYLLNTQEQRLAYLVARLPATFEVLKHVFSEIKNLQSGESFSFLDIGAGPATAAWAMSTLCPSISALTSLEINSEMVRLAQKLTSKHPKLNKMNWITGSLFNEHKKIPEADIVVASYVFNEIKDSQKLSFIETLWSKTLQYLVIVEPGTPAAFLELSKIRTWFTKNNVQIVAPCSHQNICPASTLLTDNKKEWCHFNVRVPRSSLHRLIKNAEKGYEDEKFSYLILTKNNLQKDYKYRITRHINIHKGHLKMTLCGDNGFEQKTYSKKDEHIYKMAKNVSWGDKWSEESL